MKCATDNLDDPLHDAQVIHDRHECREKDDDRQNVKRETEANDIGVGERPEHHIDARFRVADDGEYAFAQEVDRIATPLKIQDEGGEARLQRERSTHHT